MLAWMGTDVEWGLSIRPMGGNAALEDKAMRKHLVIGVLIGMVIVSCVAMVSEASDGRYVFGDVDLDNDEAYVLDTQTGTVNYHQRGVTFEYPFVDTSK